MKKRIRKDLIAWRAREDLKLQILKVLYNFKSNEEPSHRFSKQDKQQVLSEMLSKSYQTKTKSIN